MSRIRWRLLIAMIAVVATTLALSGVFTRRVTRDELRIAKRAASNAKRDVIVVDANGRVVSTSPALRGASIQIHGERVEISMKRNGQLMQLVLFMQPTPIPGTANRAYFVPRERPDEFGALDRRLIVTFAIAILGAMILAFLISRPMTRPIDDAFAKQEELRRRMVSDVAHELRTPVTNLRCELEAVQDGLAQPNIASLHEEVLHLQQLIDDLQELAIADAGGTKLRLERVDLAALLEQIVRHPIDIQARPIVLADPLRLGQIVRNLLNNAAEYAPQITLRADDRNAIVEVRDHGPGIPPAELENIFERFYRLDEARTDKGAGLGLAIVRRLVELHGGRVWAANAPDGGALFTFTIPSYDAATLGA